MQSRNSHFLRKEFAAGIFKIIFADFEGCFFSLEIFLEHSCTKLSLVFEFELDIHIEKNILVFKLIIDFNDDIDTNLMSRQKLDLLVETKVFDTVYLRYVLKSKLFLKWGLKIAL